MKIITMTDAQHDLLLEELFERREQILKEPGGDLTEFDPMRNAVILAKDAGLHQERDS